MSAKATFWAWQQQIKPATSKLVLLCLGDCHNGSNGSCFPSMPYISSQTGLDVKTVRKALRQLTSDGFISDIEIRSGRSDKYQLAIESTPTENGTPTNNGNSYQERSDTPTKNGTPPLPKTVPEPIKNLKENLQVRSVKKTPTKKTYVDENLSVSEKVKSWAAEKGYSSLETHLENFVDASLAKGYQYVDWDRAFMSAIRNNWARLPENKNEEDIW